MPPLVAVLIIWKRAVQEKRTHKSMELESKGYENANGKTCKYNLTHSLADITLAQATPIPSRDCLTLDRIPLKHTLPYTKV